MPVMKEMITQNQRSPVGDTLSRSASPPTTPARTLLVPERQIRGVTADRGESDNDVRRESIGIDDSTKIFSEPRAGRAPVLCQSSNIRGALEEIDHAGLQRILGANDEQTVFLNQFFENLRAVTQVID